MTTTTDRRHRIPAIDGARGLGVALMLTDHLLLIAGAPVTLRLLTRPGLPLFMVASGRVWHGWHRRRLLQVAAAAAVVDVVASSWLPMFVRPGILAVWLAAQAAMPAIARYPVAAVSAGILQATAIPVGWAQYEPGVIVALLALGRLAGNWPLWLGESPALRLMGRHPLGFYVGHVLVLAVLVATMGGTR